MAALVSSGVQVMSLLALNDQGAPMFDKNHAAAFACTPDLLPDLMAAAIQCQDVTRWVATQGLETTLAKG